MAADLRRVLDHLFGGLGLGPAPADPAESESFELDDAVCTVARAPSGTEVTLSIGVGSLQQDPHAATDRLRRLLRLTLGLSMVNRAALVVDDAPDEQRLRAMQSGSGRPLAFRAVALIRNDRRQEVFAALQDVVQIRTLALPHLAAAGGARGDWPTPDPMAGRGRADDGDGLGAFVIFQP